MQPAEYARMNEAEASMWWYRGLHANLLAAVDRYVTAANSVILDCGCGTGGFLARLRKTFPNATLVGIDVSEQACRYAREKSPAAILVGSANLLPFRDRSFDALISADVLYHSEVDEQQALAEAFRCLRDGGVMLANLPAFDWLRSYHDVRIHGVRRYTCRRTRQLLQDAGFRVVYSTYWNMVLFPLMVFRRKVLNPCPNKSDVGVFPAPIEALFRSLLAVERRLLHLGFRPPFGSSVLTVAIKP